MSLRAAGSVACFMIAFGISEGLAESHMGRWEHLGYSCVQGAFVSLAVVLVIAAARRSR